MPPYYESVYAIVRLIPAGRVTTYGAIADALSLGAARMVGWALNQAIHDGDVPAHRVVNRKGELSGRGHFSPPERMQALLEAEGVAIENHTVIHFDQCFWSPLEIVGE